MSQIPIDEGVYGTPVEEQLRRLEEIVQKLESEAVSLDDSIALFERFMDPGYLYVGQSTMALNSWAWKNVID